MCYFVQSQRLSKPTSLPSSARATLGVRSFGLKVLFNEKTSHYEKIIGVANFGDLLNQC